MKLTEEDREKLEPFETMSLLYAIDDLDEIRGELASDSIMEPPEIRNQLMSLHQAAFHVINEGGQFPEDQDMFELTEEISHSLMTIIENAEKIMSLVDDFQNLLPEPEIDY